MKMFVLKDVAWIEERIEHLEDILTSGAQAANEGSTGGATFLTVRQNKEILAQLYDRWEEKTGQTVQPERRAISVLNVDVSRYYA